MSLSAIVSLEKFASKNQKFWSFVFSLVPPKSLELDWTNDALHILYVSRLVTYFFQSPCFFNIPRGYFLVKKCERTAHKKALFFLSWRQRRRPTPLPLRRKNLQTSERNSDAEGERFFFGFYNRIQTFLTPYSSRLNLTQVNCTELFSTAWAFGIHVRCSLTRLNLRLHCFWYF